MRCRKAFRRSIRYHPDYKNEEIIRKIWRSAVGQAYLKAIEYQITEGYCISNSFTNFQLIRSTRCSHHR